MPNRATRKRKMMIAILIATGASTLMLPWLYPALATSVFGLFLAFLIFAYRWMDAVKDNHLHTIEGHTAKMVNGIDELKIAIVAHDVHEQEHHNAETVLLTALINKR